MPAFNWNDTINLASKLTPTRLWNGFKVLSSYYISCITRKPVQWGCPFPFHLNLLPVVIFAAPNAPVGSEHLPDLPVCFKKIFLHKRLMKFIKNCCTLFFISRESPISIQISGHGKICHQAKGIYTATSTNAHYLT